MNLLLMLGEPGLRVLRKIFGPDQGGGGGGGQDNGENSTRNFIIPTYSMKQSPS